MSDIKKKWKTLSFPGSFSSSKYLSYALNKNKFSGKNIKKVSKDLSTSILFQAHRDLRERFNKRGDIVTSFGEKFEVDIGDLGGRFPLEKIKRERAQKGKRQQLLFLLVEDVFSRKLFARGLENKSGKEVVSKLNDIFLNFAENERIPLEIESDQGKEFFNKTVETFCQQRKIKLTPATSQLKARMVERSMRSIKRIIMAAAQTDSLPHGKSWDDIVRMAADSINGRYNRDLDTTPNDVKDHYQSLMEDAWRKKHVVPNVQYLKDSATLTRGEGLEENGQLWHIGDVVITPIPKKRIGEVYDKEFLMHYDLMPSVIIKIYHGQKPYLYMVKKAKTGRRAKRLFYSRELKKIKLPKGVNLATLTQGRVIDGKGLVYTDQAGREHIAS